MLMTVDENGHNANKGKNPDYEHALSFHISFVIPMFSI